MVSHLLHFLLVAHSVQAYNGSNIKKGGVRLLFCNLLKSFGNTSYFKLIFIDFYNHMTVTS